MGRRTRRAMLGKRQQFEQQENERALAELARELREAARQVRLELERDESRDIGPHSEDE